MIKNKILAILVVCLFSVGVYADAEKDTLINNMIRDLDLAAENRDETTIAKYLDDEIHIKMNLTMGEQTQALEFTKEEFINAMKEAWPITEEYTFTRDNIHIEYIGEGNKAAVTADMYELSVVGGVPMAALSKEVLVVEFRDGQPIIISMTANTEVRM